MILADTFTLDAEQYATLQALAADVADLKSALYLDADTQRQLVIGGFIIAAGFLVIWLPLAIIKRANRAVGGYDE